MKKSLLLLTAAFLAFSVVSCSKEDDNKEKNKDSNEIKEAYIDATSSTAWHYYSFATGEIVGSADESAENNTAWGARKDWDIAIQRYNIRTNSGAFTTADAQGGVYTFSGSTTFSSVGSVPEGIQFATDKAITSEGMGGTTTVVRSEATVISFKTNEDGSLVMPPVFLPAPVYIFRSADGNNFYKVKFTQYKNDAGTSGHVIFDYAEISK